MHLVLIQRRKRNVSKEDINLLKLAGEIFVNVLAQKKTDEEHRAMEGRIKTDGKARKSRY